MILILRIAGICLGIALLITAFVFLYISLGYRSGKTSETRGYLSYRKHEKNVYKGTGHSKQFYRHWTEYTYEYRVNGKEYHIRGSQAAKPDEIRRTVTVVYQEKHPQYAYVEKLIRPVQPVLCGVCLIIGAILLVGGIFADV